MHGLLKRATPAGFGMWMPAQFPVPQNPITGMGGLGSFQSVYDVSGYPILTPGDRLGAALARQAADREELLEQEFAGANPGIAGMGMGMWMPAQFPVPQNPVTAGSSAGNYAAMPTRGVGSIRYGNAAGVGSLADYLPTLPDLGTTAGISNWVLLAGGAVLLYFLVARGGDYRDERRAAKDQYRRRISKARRTYKRGYARSIDAYREAVA